MYLRLWFDVTDDFLQNPGRLMYLRLWFDVRSPFEQIDMCNAMGIEPIITTTSQVPYP